MRVLILIAAIAGAIALVAPSTLAHGGTYHGPTGGGSPGYNGPIGGGTIGPQPGNPTPGGNNGGGVTPGSGNGGATPGVRPGAPTKGGSPAARGTPGTTGGKGKSSSSSLDWTWWWDLNEDRFLLLKSRVRGGATESINPDTFLDGDAPGEGTVSIPTRLVHERIVPSLLGALGDSDYDTRAGATIALGKIGRADDAAILAKLRSMLADSDQRVRESACLGLGLLGSSEPVSELLEIARDSASGRRACGNTTGDVPARLRCFAATAIGLIGSRNPSALGDGVVSGLLTLIGAKGSSADVSLGPVLAFQVLGRGDVAPALLDAVKNPALDVLVRANAIVALGKCGARSAIPDLLASLDDKEVPLAHAAAIALGLLVKPDDASSVAKVIRYAANAGDRGLKNFSIIAAGEIGGPKAVAFLLQNLEKRNLADSTYTALALGVAVHKNAALAAEVVPSLLKGYRAANDLEKAAFALALALCDAKDACDAMRGDLAQAGSQELRSYLCLALGMLQDRDSVPAIRPLVAQKGDTTLRGRAGIALGLLRDVEAVPVLKKVIEDSRNSKALLGAACLALGHIGDRRAADTLVPLLAGEDAGADPTARAFAAVALGLLADKDLIPLLSKLHENSAYLAQTEALAELLTIL